MKKKQTKTDKMKGLFLPINDLVIVRPVEPKNRETASGIIIPTDVINSEDLISNQEGVVLAVGNGSEEHMDGFSLDLKVNKGDTVIYEKGKALQISYENTKYDYIRGWNIIGRLKDETLREMPFIWQGRVLEPFGNRIFVRRVDTSAVIGGIALPEQTRNRSPLVKIITMGPDMPKHFKKSGIKPGAIVLFDPCSRLMAMHNWRHEDRMYCIVEASDLHSGPLTKEQLKKLNYEGETF